MIIIIVFIIWHDSKCKKSNFLPCQTKTKEQPTGYIATVQLQHIRQRIRQKDTIILYYYSIFSYHKGAWFTFQNRHPEARKGISDVFTSKPPFSSSVMSSTKRPFYAIFTHSHQTKIIKITFQNPLKPLKNKASIELNQNLQKISINYPK